MTLRALTLYFLTLGAVGFGGPIALLGYMQRDLVDRRGWFTRDEFARGLALAQVSPGPLAAQLALYLGWLRDGARGATVVGIAFVAPSLLMVLALSALYVRYGAMGWLRPAFAGVAAAVVGILARSAYRLARLTLARDRTLWALAAFNAVAVLLLRRESLVVLAASGAVALGSPRPSAPGTLLGVATPWLFAWPAAATLPAAASLFLYFAIAGVAVFGSGLAIVPYLYHGVVEEHHWLTDAQFLDAIAVSMITPGPVVITVAFIGYLVDGLPGALASALGVFLPVYLVVLLVGPHFERVVRDGRVRRFVLGVTAGATGAIAGAAVLLSSRTITDLRTAGLAVAVTLAIGSGLRVTEPLAIAAAAAISVAFL